MKFFLASLFFFFVIGANAQTVDDDHPPFDGITWSETLSVEGLMTQVLGMKEECKAFIEEMELREHHYYHESISVLREKKSDATAWISLEQIQSVLAKVEVESPQCFNSVSLYRALSSIYPSQMQDILLFAALAREGKLQPLSHKQRENLGGLWNKKSATERNRFTVMGAYDCEISTLFFDPYLPAGDLAASLQHELSHLLRDKMTTSNLSLRESLLADEIFASMEAALFQLNYHDYFFVAYSKKDDQTNNFDFTLYSREGKLRQMGPQWGLMKRIALTLDQFFDLYAKKNWAAKNLQEAYKKIQLQYFPGTQVDLSKFYSKTLEQSRAFKAPMILLPKKSSDYEKGTFLPGTDLKSIFEPQNKTLKPDFKKFLSLLTKKLRAPSRQCKNFLEKTSKGELKDYLGSELGTPAKRPGSEGVKPGSEGVKPGTGVRLCISQRFRI